MICNHNWIKSEKNPTIGKECVVENGEKKKSTIMYINATYVVKKNK